jgi:hypothetical protein
MTTTTTKNPKNKTYMLNLMEEKDVRTHQHRGKCPEQNTNSSCSKIKIGKWNLKKLKDSIRLRTLSIGQNNKPHIRKRYFPFLLRIED